MPDFTPFQAIRVGLLETRRQRELSAMFVRQGARVLSCPLIFPESHGLEEPVRKFIEEAIAGKFEVVVFYTGIGIEAVLNAARQLGKYEALKNALALMTIVARGPKGKGALKRHSLTPAGMAEPANTEGLVKLVHGLDVNGKGVAVALAGDQPNSELAEAVRLGGGEIYQFPPYHYRPPEDLGEIKTFVENVVAGEVDVLVFTTTPQVTILMEAAEKLGSAREFLHGVNSSIAVAAIGTVTAATLLRFGVRVSVRPPEAEETMRGLVAAIGELLQKRAVRRIRPAAKSISCFHSSYSSWASVSNTTKRPLPSTVKTSGRRVVLSIRANFEVWRLKAIKGWVSSATPIISAPQKHLVRC
jgi:uroporphyrinogen-III synthase